MPHYVPDAESITEFYGAYEQRGCKFEVVPAPEMGGYGLRMRFGEGSDVLPIFPLPQSEMGSVEAAERWLVHLRDHHLSLFFSLLSKNDERTAA
jgi:hypothetical protein